jgi:hypothetical protein
MLLPGSIPRPSCATRFKGPVVSLPPPGRGRVGEGVEGRHRIAREGGGDRSVRPPS